VAQVVPDLTGRAVPAGQHDTVGDDRGG
jgi:hypothetical protein